MCVIIITDTTKEKILFIVNVKEKNSLRIDLEYELYHNIIEEIEYSNTNLKEFKFATKREDLRFLNLNEFLMFTINPF